MTCIVMCVALRCLCSSQFNDAVIKEEKITSQLKKYEFVVADVFGNRCNVTNQRFMIINQCRDVPVTINWSPAQVES